MALSSLAKGWNRCAVGKNLIPSASTNIQKAGITSKPYYKRNPTAPAPFPWYKQELSWMRAAFSSMLRRFDENSKIIIVEGNVASGISKFAKELADELGFVHIPQASMDMEYKNPYGYDRRDYNHLMSEKNPCRTYDIADYNRDPEHRNAIVLQLIMYRLKWFLYCDALTHLLNTGQGCVVERSPYSDWIWLEAMFKYGHISKAAKNYYYDVKSNTIRELLRPHLCIYLDTPVSVIEKRIKERNLPGEVDSKVLTTDYLQFIEEAHKYSYLKDIGGHAELLIYDWSEGGDMELIVEDIERIDFDHWYEPAYQYEPQLHDWKRLKEREWKEHRFNFTSQRPEYWGMMSVPKFDCPELYSLHYDSNEYDKMLEQMPGEQYMPGYDPTQGDNVWFKTGHFESSYYSAPFLSKDPNNVLA